jgi:hypothetical protein
MSKPVIKQSHPACSTHRILACAQFNACAHGYAGDRLYGEDYDTRPGPCPQTTWNIELTCAYGYAGDRLYGEEWDTRPASCHLAYLNASFVK